MRPVAFAVAFAASTLMTSTLIAQREITPAQTLSGIRTAYVVIVAQDAALEAGLDTSSLRVIVELAARKLGITVLDRERYMAQTAPAAASHSGTLLIAISATRSGDHIGMHLLLSVSQYVTLLRDPKAVAFVETWGADEIAVIRDAVINERTADALNRLSDRFANDYLSANLVKR